ncbi:MAG: endonuclease/exonuclease/phosphatase family protein [Rubripirellula sp.]|jgi:endonuclease/exonuclease/phosphatase family metal-dependent hydrolase
MRFTHFLITSVASVTLAFGILGCSPKPSVLLPSESNSDFHAQPGESLLLPRDKEMAQATAEGGINPPNVSKFSYATSGSVRLLAWNVESGGNDPAVISKQLAAFQGYDVICLSEVDERNFERYKSALLNHYHESHGNTGRDDRLQIFVKNHRYDLLSSQELSRHREYTLNQGNHRSPLFVRIKDKQSGQELIVMTNHLARGNAEFRQQQAAGLREWARDQNVPVIALGDFNMDYDYRTMKGNAAFDEMVHDNVWSWIAPEDFIDTNWADRDGDGKDNYPDSMLDLAFAAGAAKEWGIECRVIVRPNDFPDDQSTSDHRPIELIYSR